MITPEQAKGLEFDSVVVVDPAGIEQASARGRADLYVALTRTTSRLGLVGPLPPALSSPGLEHVDEPDRGAGEDPAEVALP